MFSYSAPSKTMLRTSFEQKSTQANMKEEEAKPFFVFDWLDDLMADKDALQIAELLNTPSKAAKYIYQDHPEMHRCISNIEVGNMPKFSNCKRQASTQSLPTTITPKLLFQEDETITKGGSKSSATRIFKKRSVALGNGWNAKGLTKAKQGKWQGALACWDNALEIRQQICDCQNDQLEVANTWNNRGIALGKLGQFDKAMHSLQHAYAIRCSHLGTSNLQVVSTLHNIANVHHQQGNLTLALSVFGKAKSLLASKQDKDSMLVARICTAIGHVYYQAQQWIDSKDAYQDAFNMLQALSSSTNPSQAENKELQREVYELQRDIQELDTKISASAASFASSSLVSDRQALY
jgi:tetratricopeptide (TPR) repeat protein